MRSSRAAASTAPSWRQRASAAWNPARPSSLPEATSENSATSVQPCAATKARTLACWGSRPRPLDHRQRGQAGQARLIRITPVGEQPVHLVTDGVATGFEAAIHPDPDTFAAL